LIEASTYLFLVTVLSLYNPQFIAQRDTSVIRDIRAELAETKHVLQIPFFIFSQNASILRHRAG